MGRCRALCGLLVAVWFAAACGSEPGERIQTDGVGIWRTDDVFGYRHEPGTAGRQSLAGSFDVTYTIDAVGNRVTPDPASPSSRIVVLGGSFTFGHGVDDHEAWPWRLGERLSGAKVVNRAVSGWGAAHAVLALEEEFSRAAPDVVLYGYIPDHVRRSSIRASWVATMEAFGRKHPHFALVDGTLEYRGVVGLAEAVDDDAPGFADEERDVALALIQRLEEICDERDVPLAVLRFADGDDAWLQKVDWIDLNGVGGGQLRHDNHPDAAWHAAVAARLEPVVLGLLERD